MTDHTERIKETLLSIAALQSVTRGHPAGAARLPCAEVRLLSARPLRRYDDGDYLTEHEYLIQLYGTNDCQLGDIAGEIERKMGALGFVCTLYAALPPDGDTCGRTMRFMLDE